MHNAERRGTAVTVTVTVTAVQVQVQLPVPYGLRGRIDYFPAAAYRGRPSPRALKPRLRYKLGVTKFRARTETRESEVQSPKRSTLLLHYSCSLLSETVTRAAVVPWETIPSSCQHLSAGRVRLLLATPLGSPVPPTARSQRSCHPRTLPRLALILVPRRAPVPRHPRSPGASSAQVEESSPGEMRRRWSGCCCLCCLCCLSCLFCLGCLS